MIFGSSDIFEIGEFQLENLVSQPLQFTFFDLSVKSLSPRAQQLFEKAQKILENQVTQSLEELQVPKEAPIVLVCDKGKVSLKWAKKLEQMGYTNVYVLKGGAQGIKHRSSSAMS